MTKKEIENALTGLCQKPISQCSDQQLYHALLSLTQNLAAKREDKGGKKKLYYISAEFLIGKLLSNNLINLGIYDLVKELLAQNGKELGIWRKWSRSPPWETEALDGCPPVFWIPSPPWD